LKINGKYLAADGDLGNLNVKPIDDALFGLFYIKDR